MPLNKREAKKKVREIIRCLEQSGDFPEQGNCIKVAERKLEMLVKEAPASLVYELGCVYSRFKNSGGDVDTALSRLKKILERAVKKEDE
jgi:hypothetical protein